MTSAVRKSFHDHMKSSRTSVSTAGRAFGMITRQSVRQLPAPSIAAASISAGGTERK